MSQTQMFSRLAPSETSRLRQAIAAAPAPEQTIFTSGSFLPLSSSALVIAAPTMMAVPCWSSWNTGIFMRSFRRASISKHSGPLMSSRLMPPKVGSSAATVSTTRSMVSAAISMSNTSMPANFLNSTALPSITGLEASGPILPRPSTAVPLETTATRLARAVSVAASPGFCGDLGAGRGDAGRIGQRQVALVGERLGGLDLQFSGLRQPVIGQCRVMQVFGIGHSLPPRLPETSWFRWYRRSVLRQIGPDVKHAQVRSRNTCFCHAPRSAGHPYSTRRSCPIVEDLWDAAIGSRFARTMTRRRRETAFPRRDLRPSDAAFPSLEQEGAGNAGCTPHPLPYAQNKRDARRLNTGTPKSPGTPCAMVLRLIRALPGDRAF